MNGFLIDENMPQRLSIASSAPFIHVKTLGDSVSDSLVWDHAKRNGLAIVTKDADFSDRIMVSSPPPWVIRFRIGNTRRTAFLAFVSKVWPEIVCLLPAHKLINVYLDRIEAISS